MERPQFDLHIEELSSSCYEGDQMKFKQMNGLCVRHGGDVKCWRHFTCRRKEQCSW